MQGPSFGTDGVRGRAHVDLTSSYVRALGEAAGSVLGGPMVIGRDTRASGPELEDALVDGLTAAGVEVHRLGVVPTPVVAHVGATRSWPGAMISASHNPWTDNGIKLFASGGRKLGDTTQHAIQEALDAVEPPTSVADRGRGSADREAIQAYLESIVESVAGRDFEGLRVVIDCANGAAVATAPQVLARLGVELTVLHDRPDGRNINEACGSTDPASLQDAVVASGAHVGFAFDGDADRVVAVDGDGAVLDGDQLMAICAIDRKERDRLPADTVVITVMTNQGFRLGMATHGIDLVETAVGDRHVLEALDAGGFGLGGEQSGHVIFRDLATTGDGLLTAVQVLDVIHRRHRSVRDLADAAMHRLPQVLENVPVSVPVTDLTHLDTAVAAAEARLGDAGRVLVRRSGTEPVVRVMAEAEDEAEARAVVADLVAAVRSLW